MLFAYKCILAVCGHNYPAMIKIHSLLFFVIFFFSFFFLKLNSLNYQAVLIFWAVWCNIAQAPPTTAEVLSNIIHCPILFTEYSYSLSSGQWTPLQKSLVPLSPPSWTFSLHDAPAKQKVSWRTPPTPPTVSSSSYPQVDGTGVSEPAPPDCSTAFSPRLWEPWTHITPPLSETPNNTPPPLTTSQEKTVKLLSLWNSGERACTSHL